MAAISQYDRYATWLEGRRSPRDAKDEADLLSAASAYDAAIDNNSLTSDQLLRVVTASCHPHTIVWSNAVDLLAKLSARWREASTAIAEMSRSPQVQTRFAALCALGEATPVATTDAILTAGLRDRSSKIRWKSADRAERLERRNLISDIETALGSEVNLKTARSIEFHLRMLRDGYWVQPDSDGQSRVTVRISKGSTSRVIRNDELKGKGLENVLEEMRSIC